ncbi:hypothetical protein GBA52_024257 [Prunus armeniaca]|nr:hypothetical protein GBA52_024257 [Prunus armeniaca]
MAERSSGYIEGMIEEDKRSASAGKYLVWEDIRVVAAQNLRNDATSRKQLLGLHPLTPKYVAESFPL